MTIVLIREPRGDTGTQRSPGRMPCDDGRREWRDAAKGSI